MQDDLTRLTATQMLVRLRSGATTIERLVRACLARIEARDADVLAWSYLDPDAAIRAAREMDKQPDKGTLHGLPIGLKDIFDTAEMPTQHNSPLYVGSRPGLDAACVGTLRAAGALILGKTDTSEFAGMGRLAATRNPHDLARTPGGSSSGSAASVADFQVPLALGTQTGGSLIRPASYCGVYAFKPTWNAVSAEGVKLGSTTLDTVGWYGRCVADLDLLADVYDLHDDAAPVPRPLSGLRIAVHRLGYTVDPACEAALASAADRLAAAGVDVSWIDLSEVLGPLDGLWPVIFGLEGHAALLNLARSRPETLHPSFMNRVKNTPGYTRAQLVAAYDAAARSRVAFDRIADGFDAVLTVSAPDEAPAEKTAGNNRTNRDWTMLHVPCVNVPAGVGPAGMPVGLTLTGPRFSDRKVLCVAAALAPVIDV
ncbi:MAG TPA: amidase [Rhodopila sp.]|uniref:amidase n=1 Tax=Rhodopila sp. TaxID=2480087 RepID=UPI002C16D5ED|nr:amidase [Rhodopila sp.]HVY16761.1 amidase [Rhodopila sp.]